jgi:hypothetical protein
MRITDYLEVREGICEFRPRGECSLVEAVQLIAGAIAYCRDRSVGKLLVDGQGLVGVPIPSLVDRFLMAEEWAQEANGRVVVALVIQAEYIHPQKFGMKVAADFGLVSDVYTSETDALAWLSSVADPI